MKGIRSEVGKGTMHYIAYDLDHEDEILSMDEEIEKLKKLINNHAIFNLLYPEGDDA